jgi:hypothetical protein
MDRLLQSICVSFKLVFVGVSRLEWRRPTGHPSGICLEVAWDSPMLTHGI